jgi:hypothetical protein
VGLPNRRAIFHGLFHQAYGRAGASHALSNRCFPVARPVHYQYNRDEKTFVRVGCFREGIPIRAARRNPMDPLQKNVHAPAPSTPVGARCDHAGALICPNCGLRIITPAGHVLRRGRGCCPRCNHSFALSRRLARKANRLARRLCADRIEESFRRAVAAHVPWSPP